MNDIKGFSIEQFYVVAHEPGAEHAALPTWACHIDNPLGISANPQTKLVRKEIPRVPGAFQLQNVLSGPECDALVSLTEALGYLPDAAVSLPRSVRHNDNIVWVTDPETDGLIWQRIDSLVQASSIHFDRKPAVGLNARFRCYRYGEGDFFKPHTDGAWPGSRVIDGELVSNAYPDRYSQMSALIFLNDNFEGGATRFLVDADDPGSPAQYGGRSVEVDVRTPKGGMLFFPHGMHPLHCVHSSEPIVSGTKYIIRTDLLFAL